MASAAAAAVTSPLSTPHGDRDGHSLAERARQSAQALLLQWSAMENDRSASSRESAALQQRERQNTAHVLANDLQLWNVFVPPGWSAATTAVDVLREWATPTNVYFGRAGGTFLWKSEPLQTESLASTLGAKGAAANVHRSSPESVEPQHSTSAPARSPPTAGAYGLTEEELRYFGIPVPGCDESSAPSSSRLNDRKEILLAQLRGERPVVSRKRKTEGDPGHVFATATSNRKAVVIRKTKFTPMAIAGENDDIDETAPLRWDDTRLVDQVVEPLPPPLPPKATQGASVEGEATGREGSTPRSLSAPPSSSSPSPNSRARGKSLLAKNEKGIDQQFKKPGFCDATHIATLVHMFATSRALTTENGARLAERRPGDVIETIDISGTRLGKLGRWAVPIAFHADGSPILRERILRGPSSTRAFWPDEQLAVLRVGAEEEPSRGDADVFTSVSLRSVALTYIAPALYILRPRLFRITKLVAVGCDLCDEDAVGLASILRLASLDKASQKALGDCECFLETIDLSDNHITNVGADALKKSIKYHPKLRELQLRNNPIDSDTGVLNEIKRRLRNNRLGIPNVGPVGLFLR